MEMKEEMVAELRQSIMQDGLVLDEVIQGALSWLEDDTVEGGVEGLGLEAKVVLFIEGELRNRFRNLETRLASLVSKKRLDEALEATRAPRREDAAVDGPDHRRSADRQGVRGARHV